MRRRLIHHIVSLFLLSAFISPLLIKAHHDVFEHSHEKKHKHNTLSYCGHEVDYCIYSDLIYNPINYFEVFKADDAYSEHLYYNKILLVIKEYTSNKYSCLKDRAPPVL